MTGDREVHTTYLSTAVSDGSTDLDLSRRFPEFLGVFAPSSHPFWTPGVWDEGTPPIAPASDRVTAAGSAEDDGSVESLVLLAIAAASGSVGLLVIPKVAM